MPQGEVNNYVSGDDYVLEFLGYRFAFGADDFRERVMGAAVKLDLIADSDLDEEETARSRRARRRRADRASRAARSART